LQWGAVVLLLILVRLPAVRKWVSAKRQKLVAGMQRGDVKTKTVQ